MPLTGKGRNLKLADAGEGRVTFSWGADGNPQFDDAEGECVMSLLFEGPWFADRQGKRQSRLDEVRTIDPGTARRLEEFARDALQPAIDDGRLKTVASRVERRGNQFWIAVVYETPAGVSGAVETPLTPLEG